MLRGYSLGAVDFMFKPIVPEILRSKVQVFVELAAQDAGGRSARRGSSAKAKRASMRACSPTSGSAGKRTTCARRWSSSAQRPPSWRARPRSWRARSPIATRRRGRWCSRTRGWRCLSDTANRLLTGQRPHELLDELFQRLTTHLDLDVYAYRARRGRRRDADAASPGAASSAELVNGIGRRASARA